MNTHLPSVDCHMQHTLYKSSISTHDTQTRLQVWKTSSVTWIRKKSLWFATTRLMNKLCSKSSWSGVRLRARASPWRVSEWDTSSFCASCSYKWSTLSRCWEKATASILFIDIHCFPHGHDCLEATFPVYSNMHSKVKYVVCYGTFHNNVWWYCTVWLPWFISKSKDKFFGSLAPSLNNMDVLAYITHIYWSIERGNAGKTNSEPI